MITIIGNYGSKDGNVFNGQTGRTITVTKGIKNNSSEKIKTIDTSLGFFYIIQNIIFILNSRRIVVLPAQKALPPLMYLLFFLGKIQVTSYVVIGGWLPEFLKTNSFVLFPLKRLHSIHVQVKSMIKHLEVYNLNNLYVLPNFRYFTKTDKLVNNKKDRYNKKLVFYARVAESKGIELLINAVNKMDNEYTLDIYGPIKGEYKNRFFELIKNKERIRYKGVVNDNAISILQQYDLLVFPTHYEGEGFPGTILESIYAGIPVVASDWKYNKELIEQYGIGDVFDTYSKDGLIKCILHIFNDKSFYEKCKTNCKKASGELEADYIMHNFMRIVG